jgi:hypothetical protein
MKEVGMSGKCRRMIGIGNACIILVGKLEKMRPLKNLGIDGRIVLKWILRKQYAGMCTGFMWLRIRTSGKL